MNITVYCGASLGNKEVYQQATKKLGKWIAQKQHQLVYGGGAAGLMGLIANTVLENGGKVIGIIPEFLKERELAHSNLTELVVVQMMTERKKRMFDLANAFIALPGGPGTLEEISEVISWARIGQNPNPCILFNENGYFDSLRNFYDRMVQDGFLTQLDRDKILFSNDLVEIETFIQHYQAPSIRTY
ncbi:TIGR00730 family Rossman fold protein [Haemophilus paraphrohaemolyticus]|uniref:Cytokinin riboside 5'-monophosphate phosphoribohydrolase n=1 Tax=Haemophilus paraphrohaemolyticus TaxID=736 RepID=A0A369ZTN7_9PAST|nr:TIGR00730 family Rossman fold protein [Haemophilus paraphrohaemolyticus]RDF10873.1 TIGR00730 family Rossman fold protein [Haemophilus paraphrohaemolyticus]